MALWTRAIVRSRSAMSEDAAPSKSPASSLSSIARCRDHSFRCRLKVGCLAGGTCGSSTSVGSRHIRCHKGSAERGFYQSRRQGPALGLAWYQGFVTADVGYDRRGRGLLIRRSWVRSPPPEPQTRRSGSVFLSRPSARYSRLSNIFPICRRYRLQRSAPTFSPASLARRGSACP